MSSRQGYSKGKSSNSNASYTYGRNWTREGNGVFANGHGNGISNPQQYYSAVAENRYGYNAGYTNGRGETIRNPQAYYNTVARDPYGMNQ